MEKTFAARLSDKEWTLLFEVFKQLKIDAPTVSEAFRIALPHILYAVIELKERMSEKEFLEALKKIGGKSATFSFQRRGIGVQGYKGS